MKILQILCHPDYNNKKRISNLLAKLGEEELRKNDLTNIETLNLYSPECYIPTMDKNMFNYNKENLTETERKDKVRQEELLKQWKNAEAIFIYMPLHNFNVVSKFKDYIDNIVIVNETFKCEIETMIGLDNPNKKVTFIITSGGEFDNHIQYVNLDFAVQFMRGILSILGINNMKLIRVQGLDLVRNNKAEIVEQSKTELKEWVKEFSAKNK
ncbi:NAD(P)H-dependent oxidoreductase [Gemella cuniculi]|uniref:NAD(P)H-dependent oxidoreductase n=1 Tax=Gemella cuniculi TaxID=150240 RepID=UPI0004295C15|nr:NAD(P)H-dependent oxidoreductase [Gemella cuniculi]